MSAHSPDALGDATRALLDAMRREGIEPAEPIAGSLASGRLIRFRAHGDKPGRRNGWAVTRAGGWAFGHWRLGIRRSERAAYSGAVTAAERARWRRELAAAERLRARERAAAHAQGQAAALALWRGAVAADGAHPYLVAKRMTPDGLRVSGRWLLVPMRDLRTGELGNVQRIGPDEAKRFQRGARVTGLVWGRGKPGGTIALCEGVATAAAVHTATGLCAVAAMSKVELAPAALALRRRWPAASLIAGADRDADGGGEQAATDAMRAVSGLVALPPRPPGYTGPAWDFADLWLAPGGAALIRAAFGIGSGDVR